MNPYVRILILAGIYFIGEVIKELFKQSTNT
jgi:hypothetical protein